MPWGQDPIITDGAAPAQSGVPAATPAPATGGWGKDPVVGASKYRFSDDAIRQYEGQRNVDVVYMTPQQYLALSPKMESNPATDRKGASLKKSLDAGDEVNEIPSLDVSIYKDGAKVTSQDGRHRAQFAKDNGLDMIPVAIKRSGKGDITELEGMTGEKVKYDFKPVPMPAASESAYSRFMRGMSSLTGQRSIRDLISGPETPPPPQVPESERGLFPSRVFGPGAADLAKAEKTPVLAPDSATVAAGLERRRQELVGTGKDPKLDPEYRRLQADAARAGIRDTEDVMMFAPGGATRGIAGLAENALARLARAAKTPAEAAREAGYVLPPAMLTDSPGPVANTLAGWGGKIKLQQAASVRNQEVTNRLGARSLGLPENTTLTEDVFSTVRRKASEAYQAVVNAVPEIRVNATFKNAIAQLGGRSSQAAEHFPNLVRNEGIEKLVTDLGEKEAFPTQAGVELVRNLRADATTNLKAIGAPDKHALGLAQRQAADAVDALIEDNVSHADRYFADKFAGMAAKESEAAGAVTRARQQLTIAEGKLSTNRDIYVSAAAMKEQRAAQAALDQAERNLADIRGQKETMRGRLQAAQADATKGDLVNRYRAARQLIAKSHDVEAATNSATGDVSARGLARLADKGRPLTGELDTIANSAKAFPKAFQNPTAFGGDESLSALDFFGSALSVAHGHPSVAGMILGRPIARQAALSDYIQNRILSLQRPSVQPPRNALAALSALARPMPAVQGVNQFARMQVQRGYPQQQPILPMPGQQPTMPQPSSPDQGAR